MNRDRVDSARARYLADNENIKVAVQQDDGEDWPILTALLAGLAVALLANTFFGLIPA